MKHFNTRNEPFYFVMPLITGGTLAELVRRGPVDPMATCHWISQIATALDIAHQEKIVHRDLKPTNVLLDEKGDAYLTDFGIAWLTSTTTNSGLTQTGTVVGTPGYMAPEQWRAEKLDARTDVYGLGVMTFLMLCGHLPFRADTAHAMMYQHLDQAPPDISVLRPDLPTELNLVIQKALAKEPADRYDTTLVFAEDLRNAIEEKPLSITAADVPPPESIQPTVPSPSIQAPIPSQKPAPSVDYPPPVYGPGVNSTGAPAYPHQQPPRYPSPPNILRQQQRKRWRNGMLAFGATIVMVFLLVVAGAFALGVVPGDQEADDTNSQPANAVDDEAPANNSQPINDTSSDDTSNNDQQPAPQNPANARPSVTILSPANNSQTSLNQPLAITFSASDSQGVTRVELRRLGIVLEAINIPGETRYDGTFRYTPDGIGNQVLQVVAFREEVAGDPQSITITVEE